MAQSTPSLPAGGQKKRPKVLVVDDEQAVTALFARLLAREGYEVDVAYDGASALTRVAANPPDVILTDVMMPGLDGLSLCRRLKRDPQTRLTPVVLITALTAREHRIEGLEAGADDFLSKPVHAEELLARVRASVRTKRYTDDLDSAAAIIMTLAEMIEARDEHTDGHCYRMAHHATALGRRLGLDSDALQALYRGGFLHDIGMLAIPDPVLRKAGPLEPEEYELIKSHTTIGDSLVANLRSLQGVRPIVRHHHERCDGSGYPDGLRGDDIPLLAQILSIVDVYDAVTSDRAYQRAKSGGEAIDVLRAQATRGWRRPELVEEFAALIAQGSVGSTVAPLIHTTGGDIA